ncbi:hydantoinase/oxoprolinase family protein [Streptomyces cadmiisoli]|uniref:Hydantoinase/oxoprolinase family protein n=1 Tax=Streptomyces cadmiisoli TaxID=2184053 RepID=A0A2Z4J9D4_9ACTN|nr:hydantoinase/oxoprolinase family protein [Streptomyces cadmiisoli]AWW41646.1 hydantoinase/oxoprolinase family protein [Streptomyces cadmiisoli]
MRIGVECGGTFTDLVVLDDDGVLRATDKVFSTPSHPDQAVTTGLRALSAELRDEAVLLHGSTVATNALIERNGARVGLIVTRGFRDVLELQRQDRTSMYDLTYRKPAPLVPREWVAEVTERLDRTGAVLEPLDDDSVRAALARLVTQGVDAVAVSLLHSYADPAHEQRIAVLAEAEFPGLVVSLSSSCAREFREYERTTTTTIDAFLRPRIHQYLSDLEASAHELGIGELHVMQSNGGMVPARAAASAPLSMLRSGPAAGVAGAIAVAENAGVASIVTMDMGGTSTDVAVVHDGRPELTTEVSADGLPVRVPMVDITAVGAGGGSLVDVDSGGLLTVGPRSAGADPGPVCYGKGGTRPTVTDANAVRGLLRPETFLGGRHTLHTEAAREALRPLAERLDRSVEQTAEDVYQLTSIAMAGAIRVTTTERGYDVKSYTLVAYGGAGPLHAATVAEELGMSRVIIPPHAGLASAYGLLTAGFRREFSQTFLSDVSALPEEGLRPVMAQLRAVARDQLQAQGVPLEDADFSFSADMRYEGQGFEMHVDLPHGTGTSTGQLLEGFHEVHARRYGHAESSRAVQVVTVRLAVTRPRPPLVLPRVDIDTELPVHTSPITEKGTVVEAVFRSRRGLAVGAKQRGPAVIEDGTSTTFVPTGWFAHVDEHTNLLLERS